jgi:hypothetical protein
MNHATKAIEIEDVEKPNPHIILVPHNSGCCSIQFAQRPAGGDVERLKPFATRRRDVFRSKGFDLTAAESSRVFRRVTPQSGGDENE